MGDGQDWTWEGKEMNEMRSFKTPTGMSQPVLDPGWSDIQWELNHLNHSCLINWVNHQTYEDVNDINVWFSTANSEIHRGYVLFPSLPVFFPSKATRPSQLRRVSTWTAQSQGEVDGWQDDWFLAEHLWLKHQNQPVINRKRRTDGWTPNTLLQTHCFFCAGMGWANMMMVTGWFLRHGSPKFDYDETTWTAVEIIEKSQLTWVSGITSCQCNTLYPQHHVVASRATLCQMRFPQYLPESQPGLDLGASVLSKKPLRLVLVFLRAVHRGLPAWLGDGCEIVHFLQMRRSWTPKKYPKIS
jgi:hypothetical protein